jgi:hypothetical protein
LTRGAITGQYVKNSNGTNSSFDRGLLDPLVIGQMFYEEVFRKLWEKRIRYARGKGFAFRIPPERLREFRALSAEEKLDWLEEANRFVADFVSREKMERWRRFLEDPDRQ